MTRSPGILVALALLAASLAEGQAEAPERSQSSTTTAAEGADVQEPPRPIRLAEIPRRSEEASLRLGEIEASLSPEPRVETIASELPDWTERLNEALAVAERRRGTDLSLRDLSEAENRWLAMEAQVDEWLTELESRTTELESALNEVRELGRSWSATQEAEADPPATVRDTITDVLERVEGVERATENRLATLLELQNGLAEQAVLVREELARLQSAQGDARDSLFGRDAAPLWTALARDEDRAGLARQAVDSWRTTWSAMRDYVRESPDRFLAQGLAFLALFWLFVRLSKKLARLEGLPGLEPSVRALSHPVANALLLTLLLTRLFHPRAALGIYELNRLLLLAPLLIVLPGLVYASMRKPLFALAALYVADLVVDLFPTAALLTRLMQLALSAIALLGLLQLTRPGGAAARLELGRWWRAALTGARLGAVLLGLGVAANLLGRVRLSVLVTDATLTSAYTAVVLFAGALVLHGLVVLAFHTRLALSIRSVGGNSERLIHLGVRLVRLVALVSWAAATASAFHLLDPFVGALRSVMGATLAIGEIEISLGNVLALGLSVYLSLLLSRVLRVVLEEDVLPQFSLPRGVPGAISMLAHYVVLLIGFLFAFAAAGIETSRFAILAGALGVGIGFGLQNIVNNFVSGLVLLFERPIQVGDTIELEALFGKVSRIGIRSSTVRTFEGAEVIVPNAHLIDSRVVNWTLSDRLRRIEVTVGVAYGSRPRTVVDTLVGVAKDHEDILDEPEPYALFEGFGDSSLDFILRAWTANFDSFLRIRSELKVGVHDALEAAGFVIPFPQRDLHVKSLPEGAGAQAAGNDEKETGGR